MSAEYEIQKSIYAKLRADANLSALLAKDVQNNTQSAIYDNVPEAVDSGSDSVFPYVTIGDDTAVDWDTDNSQGKEATLTIHSWSRYRGRKEVKEIQGAIYNALHLSNLIITGYHSVLMVSEYSETLVDPDGLTRHGVQRFRLIVEKE
jgi:hypothetical protein